MQPTSPPPLTPIPITLPPNQAPSKPSIKKILSTFFPKEWSLVNPEDIKITYRNTYTNPQCIVSRPPPGSATSSATEPEPVKVFIKFFDAKNRLDIEAFAHLLPSKEEEVVLCHAFSLTGYGAKVYGAFRTEDGVLGRVDEWVDGRNLEPGDVEGEEGEGCVRGDVARGMAAFHALDVPGLGGRERGVGEYYEALGRGLRKYRGMERLKVLGREGGVAIDDLVNYDFASRVRIVLEAMQSIKAKTGWCNHDVQFMNTMVRNRPQPSSSKILLVDFEFAMRNYRAFDIGGHFMQKMFKWFDEESKIAACRPYTENGKRDFCAKYVEEWNRITGDGDSVEQVLMEAEYGFLLAVTFDVHNMLWFMCEMGDKDPLSLEALNKLLDEFRSQYGKLRLREPG